MVTGQQTVDVDLFAAENAKLITIWGMNWISTKMPDGHWLTEARLRGSKVITIAPEYQSTSNKADEVVVLRPGTDGALALGLMREWIEHDRIDHDYVERHVSGFDELRANAMAWTPERTAQACGIDADEVRSLARTMADAKPLGIRLNYGMQRAHGGGNAVHLAAMLPCLLGSWRHRGGGLLLSSSGWANPVKREAQLQRVDLLAGRNPRTINMSTIGGALLQSSSPAFGPRIDALIVYDSNPVAVAPESPKVVKGFAREDLFTVVLEHFMTDTADHADFVLPATTQLEHLDILTAYGHTDVLFNEPAIAPVGEAKPNTQIFRELAARMGFTDPCFADDDETLARQAIDWDKLGCTFDELRAKGWQRLQVPDQPFADGGFLHADGKAHAEGADYVPNHESAESSPALAARFPLAMISPPARHFLNSSFVNVKSLRDIEGEPVLEMHADDAAARGIADGAMVSVFNDRGDYRCRARIDNGRARRGVVNGLGVWWRKLGAAGSNVNEVTSQKLTDLGAAPTFYDCLVEVRAA
jgi:anaerobic selenocysteine-containing dehydrogenase